jgi:lipopolysaccharide/colanic/teichoic acid biosynthesis glycosyltransferase
MTQFSRFLKRVMDLAAGATGMVVLALCYPLIALAIKWESRGPVLFKQTRVGKDRKPFTMYKFRSMCLDAEKKLSGLIDMDRAKETGEIFKQSDDPRITRVGGFLRRTSLDELPQVWNVLRGDMSLVGPRALLPHMVAPFPEWNEQRSVVPPGITGLWQVSARERNTSLRDMIEYDLAYIKGQSLAMDMAILARTVGVLIGRHGAE